MQIATGVGRRPGGGVDQGAGPTGDAGGVARRVTRSPHPGSRCTATSPHSSSWRTPRLALSRDIPSRASRLRVTGTVAALRQPASNHRPSPTASAWPGNFAAASIQAQGIGPLRNFSPDRCRGRAFARGWSGGVCAWARPRSKGSGRGLSDWVCIIYLYPEDKEYDWAGVSHAPRGA